MKRLTILREQRGWTKAELGRQAAMHPSTVGKIENGREVPYPGELAKLARALGVRSADANALMEEVRTSADWW